MSESGRELMGYSSNTISDSQSAEYFYAQRLFDDAQEKFSGR
jgi:hypothetical protein